MCGVECRDTVDVDHGGEDVLVDLAGHELTADARCAEARALFGRERHRGDGGVEVVVGQQVCHREAGGDTDDAVVGPALADGVEV